MATPSTVKTLEYERSKERLSQYFNQERVHHALIFVGPETEEKLELAKYFAAKLMIAANPTKDPSGITHRIQKEIHPDFLSYTEEDSPTIKIETIRQLCHEMEIAPIEGGAKVCLINHCHRMTVAAANAFLKALEEPKPNRYFLLLTHQVESLIPTVLSRCLQLSLSPDNEQEPISEQEQALFGTVFSEWLTTQHTSCLKPVLTNKEKTQRFVQYLQKQIRQHILDKKTLNGIDELQLLVLFDRLVELEGQLRSNVNYGLMLEVFLLRLVHQSV